MLTANIDVDRSIVAFRKEDGKTELTIFTTPLSTVEATPAIHLIPSPGVSDETALKQTAEIITSLTDSTDILALTFRTSFPSAHPRPYASYGSMPAMIRARRFQTSSQRKASSHHAATER